MGKIRLLAGLAVVGMLLSGSSALQATEISGSLPFAAFGVTQNNTNLSTSTMFTSADELTSNSGTGDFSIVPIGTMFSGFTLDLTTISSGGGFTFSNSTYGSYAATSGSIVMQSQRFLNVELLGTFTPGPAFNGLGPAPADVDLSFTQRGTSVSGSFTMSTTVPEPGTMALLGSGLLTLAAVVRRKFAM